MNAPLIWIAFPLAVAVLLFFLQRRRSLDIVLAGIVCFTLAAIALLAPIDALIRIGPITFSIPSTLEVLGRRFVLDNGSRTFLTLMYVVAGFWLLGAGAAGANRLFVPMGLGMAALLVAVDAVQPFLYAALLVEIAVLLSIPMLAPPGRTFSQGLLRYLIFMTLAMPFILLAGGALSSVDANPSEVRFYGEAEVFLGLGFAFWLAVFPFYTWIPLLAEQSHPYVAGFVLVLLPTTILMLPLSYLEAYAWLRTSTLLFTALRMVGLLMVGTSGIWAAFQSNQARLLGYAVILETGYSLLALSLGIPQGLGLYAQLFVPRIVALALASLALAIWRRQQDFTGFDAVDGLLRRSPFVAISFLLAYFSLGGLPLLAGFPVRQVLLENLSGQSLSIAFWVLVGNAGFLLGGIRSLVRMAGGSQAWQRRENLLHIAMLVAGVFVLFLFGLFPGWLLPSMLNLLAPFIHLK